MQIINSFFIIRRLKINHKSLGSYGFILEKGAAANSYSFKYNLFTATLLGHIKSQSAADETNEELTHFSKLSFRLT